MPQIPAAAHGPEQSGPGIDTVRKVGESSAEPSEARSKHSLLLLSGDEADG